MVEKLSLDDAVDELHTEEPEGDDSGQDGAAEQDEELEAQEGEGEDEGEGDEGGEQEAAGDDDGEDPYQQLVTVKVDGKDEQVTLREALDGYIRQRTFHQRMSEADVARKTAEAAINDTSFRQRHYIDSIEIVKQLIAQQGLAEPKREDYDDPVAFLEAKDAVAQRIGQIRQLSQVQADEMRQHQAEQLEMLRVQAQRETRVFYEHPEMRGQWRDNKTFRAHMEKTKQWAQDRLGYTKQELASIYDHRAAIALTKARLYDEGMARAAKRVAEKTKGAKPFVIRGNVSGGQQRGGLNGASRAKAAFNKAPSIETAVEMMVSGGHRRH